MFVAAVCAMPEIGAQAIVRESVSAIRSVLFIFASRFLLEIRKTCIVRAYAASESMART